MSQIAFKALVAFLLITIGLNKASAKELSAEQALSYLTLPKNHAVSGKFRQKKFFRILSSPFLSNGTYQYVNDQFEWQTVSPVLNKVVFDGEKLWQIDPQGLKTQMPVAGHFVTIVQALLLVDMNTLSTFFRFVEVAPSNCLKLEPKEATIASIADSITLCSQEGELTLRMMEKSGNYTDIVITPNLKNGSHQVN
ncbi:outer membrane lipoprotein carrier protein LolA [Thalassotalea ganghwensis]